MKLVNVVAQTSINTSLDLRYIALNTRDVKYSPSKFTALCWHHKHLNASCLVFPNGKLVAQGARSYHQARVVIRRYARLIQRLGYNVRLDPITIVTMTCVASVGCALDLRLLASRLEHCQYEPELFNAMVLKQHNITFSVFASGKVVVTGLKRTSDMSLKIMPVLLELAVL